MASASLERAIRDAVTSIDPSLPVFDARRMMDRVQESWGSQRLLSFLFSVFAGLALMLATIGLYGLLAYTALKRVREIGIRLALGARPDQIRTLILSHGLQLLLIGSVIGVVAAFALSRDCKACFSMSTDSTQESILGSARFSSQRPSLPPGFRPPRFARRSNRRSPNRMI